MALAPIVRAPFGDIGWDHVFVYPDLAPRLELSSGGHIASIFPDMTCKTRLANIVMEII